VVSVMVKVSCYVLLTMWYSSDQIKEDEMGRSCGLDGGQEKLVQGFDEET
jgi:hypothetical protein